MYERFTDRARKVMKLAKKEAKNLRHEYIGTEHILLGLLIEGTGVAGTVLSNFDLNKDVIRQEISNILQPGLEGPGISGKLEHTPGAKKCIEHAIEEGRKLKHNYVGTEHILLGLLRGEEDVAHHVLDKFGLKIEDVREEVFNLLGQGLMDSEIGPPWTHEQGEVQGGEDYLHNMMSRLMALDAMFGEIKIIVYTATDSTEALDEIKELLGDEKD